MKFLKEKSFFWPRLIIRIFCFSNFAKSKWKSRATRTKYSYRFSCQAIQPYAFHSKMHWVDRWKANRISCSVPKKHRPVRCACSNCIMFSQNVFRWKTNRMTNEGIKKNVESATPNYMTNSKMKLYIEIWNDKQNQFASDILFWFSIMKYFFIIVIQINNKLILKFKIDEKQMYKVYNTTAYYYNLSSNVSGLSLKLISRSANIFQWIFIVL